MPKNPISSPPPWEVLVLVAHHLDAKTLAIASCVSKLWSTSMSSDNVWKPIFTSHFPSLSTLQHAQPTVPFRRLFSLGRIATNLRRQNPPKPNISLHDLTFIISISTANSHVNVITLTVPCNETTITADPRGTFRFDVEVGEGEWVREEEEEVRVTWHVVMRGWRGVFCMMESVGKAWLKAGSEVWLSVELPTPGCCRNVVASSVVADLKLAIFGGKGEGRVRVGKVSLGILNAVDWRYVTIDDGLRYLHHFLNSKLLIS